MKPKTIALLQLGALALFLVLVIQWVFGHGAGPGSVAGPALDEKPFPDVALEARSAYVYDVRAGKAVFEKEPNLQLPLASLTKVMSALAASRLAPDYLVVRISRDDMREEGDSGLFVDEEWNIGRLIDFSLLVSSNDGMRAIASVAGTLVARATEPAALEAAEIDPTRAFVQSMNQVARELGLAETYFLNQSGLDVNSSLSGGYGSAHDMVRLVSHIIETDPGLLEATSKANAVIESKTAAHYATNTNQAIYDIPNVIASKTGFTDLSGGNLVVAWNAGLDRPMVAVVLGSSYEGRFSDMRTLVEATTRYMAQ